MAAAPEGAIIALAVVIIVPLLMLAWYYTMYKDLGSTGLTGGGLSGEPET